MTFNIGFCGGHHGLEEGVQAQDLVQSRLNAILKIVRQSSCDIVVLQEVDRHSRRSAYVNQYQSLVDHSGYPFHHWVSTWQHPWVPFPFTLNVMAHFGPIDAGQLILSRHPILTSDILDLPQRIDRSVIYNWFYLHQKYHEVRISILNQVIRIGHLHLEAFSVPTRRLQMQRIAEQIADVPTILAGDFNTSEGDSTLDSLQKVGLTPCKGADLLDFPAWAPMEQLSYVVHSRHFSGTAMIDRQSQVSDHFPMMASLELKNLPRI